jgi:deoxycytidine triphosphate deaminase
MIRSDRSIREEIAKGRIEIDPFGERCVQPSSVDRHVDRTFRTFHNTRYSCGSNGRGSKYQGQRGPTASRFFEGFLQELGTSR